MVFAALDEAVPIPASLASGHVVIVTDTLRSDGSFVLHHFLGRFARLAASRRASDASDDRPWTVALLSMSQTLEHWRAVSKKLGWDLGRNLDGGSLHFLDGFGMLAQWPGSPGENPEGRDVGDGMKHLSVGSSPQQKYSGTGGPAAGRTKRVHPLTLPQNLDEDLGGLLSQVSDVLSLDVSGSGPGSAVHGERTSNRDHGPVCIMVDDLTALLDWGCTVPAVLDFFGALRNMAAATHGALIALVHGDTVTLDTSVPLSIFAVPVADEGSRHHSEQTALVQSLRYAADLMVDIVTLPSGVSRDVHGQLNIRSGPLVPEIDLSYHYKVNDGGVQFWKVGLSSGVI